MAGIWNPSGIYQGDAIDWEIGLVATDTNVPVDCTGATLRMQIRPFAGDTGTPYADLSIGDGLEWVDAANGIFTVFVAAAKTAAIPEGQVSYDVELTPAAGASHAWKPLAGRFSIKARTTR